MQARAAGELPQSRARGQASHGPSTPRSARSWRRARACEKSAACKSGTRSCWPRSFPCSPLLLLLLPSCGAASSGCACGGSSGSRGMGTTAPVVPSRPTLAASRLRAAAPSSPGDTTARSTPRPKALASDTTRCSSDNTSTAALSAPAAAEPPPSCPAPLSRRSLAPALVAAARARCASPGAHPCSMPALGTAAAAAAGAEGSWGAWGEEGSSRKGGSKS